MHDDRCFDLPGGLRVELCEDPVPDDGSSVRVRVSDTYGVLAPIEPVDPGPGASPAKTLAAAERYAPPPQGSVHWVPAARTESARIRAVVYDFDRDPATSAEIVHATLEAVLEKAHARAVETLVLPYDFGLSHGGIGAEAWHRVLGAALRAFDGGAGGHVELTLRLEVPSSIGVRAVAAGLVPHLLTLH